MSFRDDMKTDLMRLYEVEEATKINKENRKEIWDRYSDLEFLIRDLKNIVQNDIDIFERYLTLHTELTNKAIRELKELSKLIQEESR